jgi:alanine racemase
MTPDPASRAGAILEIDLGAVVANWRTLAAKAAPATCAAVVKANGYGLGAARVARALVAAGCNRFFVATLDEGIALRQALGPKPEIAVLNGPLPGSSEEFVAARLMPVLNDPNQIEAWSRLTTRGECPPAMIHVDTGMSRLGLSPMEFEASIEHIASIGAAFLISHLACADTPAHPLNAIQRERFFAARHRLPGLKAESRRLVRHLSRSRVSFRLRAARRGALRRQSDTRQSQPDAPGRASGRQNAANPQN